MLMLVLGPWWTVVPIVWCEVYKHADAPWTCQGWCYAIDVMHNTAKSHTETLISLILRVYLNGYMLCMVAL